MYLTAFSIDESRRIAVETDAMVQKAVDAMPKAGCCSIIPRKIVAQRMAAQTR